MHLTLILLLCSKGIIAQSAYTENTLRLDSLSNIPKAEIDELSWLAGNWVGEAFGGLVEDVWLEPLGGTMVGIFRSYSGGEIGFYELLIISEVENSLILKLKHFNSDLTGWEEKNTTQDFRLVKISKDTAWFEGFTIRKDKKDKHTIFVAMERSDGTVKEMEFNYRKRKN
ncbi:MAG: hypothetical protein BalsKO_24600 [Balneolaceae bacterium]